MLDTVKQASGGFLADSDHLIKIMELCAATQFHIFLRFAWKIGNREPLAPLLKMERHPSCRALVAQ